MANSDEEHGEQRLVVTIDYGTTFTGVAFARANQGESLSDFKIISNWSLRDPVKEVLRPSSWGRNLPTVNGIIGFSMGEKLRDVPLSWTKLELGLKYDLPCEFATAGCGLRFHPEQFEAWISHSTSHFDSGCPPLKTMCTFCDEEFIASDESDGMDNWRKRMLHIRDHQRGGERQSKTIMDLGKKPEEIVTDYLSHIFQHIQSELGSVPFDACPIDVVMTVPEIWPDKAMEEIYQAAARAGSLWNKRCIPLVQEPKAATVYALETLDSRARENDIQKSGCFALCDAGGGTVDLVSYRAKSLSSEFGVGNTLRQPRPNMSSKHAIDGFWGIRNSSVCAVQGNNRPLGQNLLLREGINRSSSRSSRVFCFTIAFAAWLMDTSIIRLNQLKDLWAPSNLLLALTKTASSTIPHRILDVFTSAPLSNESLLFTLFAIFTALHFSIAFLSFTSSRISKKAKIVSVTMIAASMLSWAFIGVTPEELFLVFLPQCISFGVICGSVMEYLIAKKRKIGRLMHLQIFRRRGVEGRNVKWKGEKTEDEFGDEKTGLMCEV